MEEQKQPEIKIPSVGERLAGLLLDSTALHQNHMQRARGLFNPEEELLLDNVRQVLRVRSLPKIIGSQMGMISLSRGVIRHQNEKKDEPNDYNKLMESLSFLKFCEEAIIDAERTKCFKDDFMVVLQKNEGDVHSLTDNFYEMLEDLETSFENIYIILLRAGLLTDTIRTEERRKKLNEIF